MYIKRSSESLQSLIESTVYNNSRRKHEQQEWQQPSCFYAKEEAYCLRNVVREGNKVILSNKKIGFSPSQNLADVALEVVTKHTKVLSGSTTINRNIIEKVLCKSTDITECWDYSLSEIDSPSSRIFDESVKIVIKAALPTSVTPKKNAFSMMMNSSSTNYLPHENVRFPFLAHTKTGAGDETDTSSNGESDEDPLDRIHTNTAAAPRLDLQPALAQRHELPTWMARSRSRFWRRAERERRDPLAFRVTVKILNKRT